MLGNGPQVLGNGNGLFVLGNGLHLLGIMLLFGILSLCRIRTLFCIVSFGIMSSGVMSFGLLSVYASIHKEES